MIIAKFALRRRMERQLLIELFNRKNAHARASQSLDGTAF
jgi:hypothetical protein